VGFWSLREICFYSDPLLDPFIYELLILFVLRLSGKTILLCYSYTTYKSIKSGAISG
jgi:hypothetical protein